MGPARAGALAVKRTAALGPILYGGLFVVALPALLLLWAWGTEPYVAFPTPAWSAGGWILVAIGAALMGAGMMALRVHGGGLPMNAYPPPVFVDRGVYRLLAHPIYVGFGLVAFGVSVAFGSASGLWLVAPLVCVGMMALVLGYEKPDLRRRFGETAMRRPLLSLPGGGEGPPSTWERVSVVMLVLVPWMLAYEAVFRLGVPTGAIEAYLPFERGWPVWVWTEPIYASVYPLVGLVPSAEVQLGERPQADEQLRNHVSGVEQVARQRDRSLRVDQPAVRRRLEGFEHGRSRPRR